MSAEFSHTPPIETRSQAVAPGELYGGEQAFTPAEASLMASETAGITPSTTSAVEAIPQPYGANGAVTETSGAPSEAPSLELDPTLGDRLHGNRVRMASELTSADDSPRTAARLEEVRVDALLDEPAHNQSALMLTGKAVLVKVGLLKPESYPKPEEQARQEHIKATYGAELKAALDESREVVRRGYVAGVDDVAIDRYLKLRGDTSLLPPLFRDFHHQAEVATGQEMSFLTWMTDHATDEQLTNVWQWHDHYLNELDTAPEFVEQIANVKAAYVQGTEAAIAAQKLHPNMGVTPKEIDDIKIMHGSPLSPITAFADASANIEANEIMVRPQTNDQVLTHEIAHLRGQLIEEFNEGVTDLMASVVYEHSHGAGDTYEKTRYSDQLRMLEHIEHLTEGVIDPYILSYLYGRNEAKPNSIMLLSAIEDEGLNGMPLLVPIVAGNREMGERFAGKYPVSQIIESRHKQLADAFGFLDELFFDAAGHKIAHTPRTLAGAVLKSEVNAKHDANDIIYMITYVGEAAKIEGQLNSSAAEREAKS